jgi:hypothetical protein
MEKKFYKKPIAMNDKGTTGLPTALAIGLASAAASAAAVAVGRMVGIDSMIAIKLNSTEQIIGEANA